MLPNLNKPTVRGIKKCSYCGYYNGNRSKHCKNQNCTQFIKQNVGISRGVSVDPILLRSDDDVQHYSVKVAGKHVDRCESRSFVQISEKSIQMGHESTSLPRIATCFADTCKYDRNTGISANCKHVEECLRSCHLKVATDLPLSQTKFLKFFSHVAEEVRTEAWQYCSKSRSPIIQQLSDKLYVVKGPGKRLESEFYHCELGHKSTGGRYPVFTCSCKRGTVLGPMKCDTNGVVHDYCTHILMLYSALDGHKTLKPLFQSHLEVACAQLDLHELDLFDTSFHLDLKTDELINEMIDEGILLGQSLELSDCELEFVDDSLDHLELYEHIKLSEECSVLDVMPVFQKPLKRVGGKLDQSDVDEANLSVSFDSILTSVIERINNSMQSSGDDIVHDFIFHVHNDFFDCLNERFSPNPHKKCLPSETFFHRSGPLRGLVTNVFKFYKPTTLRRIFASKSTTILLERIFSHAKHHESEANGLTSGAALPFYDVSCNYAQSLPICCYKKCINLQYERGPDNCLRISWTANVLPTSSHGELKISLRYDYKRIK